MMSATSRRKFLSGAAVATAAACASACNPGSSTTPSNPPGNTPPVTPPTAPPQRDADEGAATAFLSDPKFLDPALDTTAKLSMLLYGLVCVDFGGQELLLPNTQNLSAFDVHPHRARLWLTTSTVQAGSAPEAGKVIFDSKEYSFWDINKMMVTVEALDATKGTLASTSAALVPRNSPLHPWTDIKWVRCLKDVSNKPMLPKPSRNNVNLISARVDMGSGGVTAISPSTARGQLTQWKLTNESGVKKAHATTDAMVWQRAHGPGPKPVAGYKITLSDIPSGTKKEIAVTAIAESLVAAVTHAMPTMPLANPNLLTDTRAFAQLLVGGDVSKHPTPDLDRNEVPQLAASGSDGHCECGCN